ncbi:MAG TPA: hypothetical protein VFG50_13870 [Rhodothermales bacterium]|nr:hypothetical protein [Rhodothermales bacterium]
MEKGSLTPDEINNIAALDLEPDSLVWHVQGWFLFAFYPDGMRFSDVALLERSHLRGGRISYKMK